jgi:hypothetical protein
MDNTLKEDLTKEEGAERLISLSLDFAKNWIKSEKPI